MPRSNPPEIAVLPAGQETVFTSLSPRWPPLLMTNTPGNVCDTDSKPLTPGEPCGPCGPVGPCTEPEKSDGDKDPSLTLAPVIVPSLIFLLVMVLFLRSLAVMLPSLMSLPVISLAAVAAPADPAKAIAVTMAMGTR